MKVNKTYCYVAEKPEGWVIKIEVPDYNNRNYLHSRVFDDLQSCMEVRDFVLTQQIDENNTTVRTDEKYYRLIITLGDKNGKTLLFHSRKLNLHDLQKEWDLFLHNDQ